MSSTESRRSAVSPVASHGWLRAFVCGVLVWGFWPVLNVSKGWADESYAIAMHGVPQLPADFAHMPYANPDAPKGGRLVQGLLGTFDSLNPMIVRGIAAQRILGFIVESRTPRGNAERFTLYGLLAKSIETDEPRSFVTFRL